MAIYADLVKANLIESFIFALRRCTGPTLDDCYDQAERSILKRFTGISPNQLDRARADVSTALRFGSMYRPVGAKPIGTADWGDGLERARNVRYVFSGTVEVSVVRNGRVVGTQKRFVTVNSRDDLGKSFWEQELGKEGLLLVQKQFEQSPKKFGKNRFAGRVISVQIDSARRERI